MVRALILAALAWLVVAASPPKQAGQPQDNQVEQQIANSLDRMARAAENDNEADRYNAPCKPGADNRRSDLCAQWKAADAADEAVTWTRRSTYIAMAAAVIGLLTLGAAGAAAYFAMKAAEHTDTAAKQAKRQADVAELGNRPWVIGLGPQSVRARRGHVDGVPHTGLFSVCMRFENGGKSPAVKMRMFSEVRVVEPGRLEVFVPDESNQSESVMGPGVAFSTGEHRIFGANFDRFNAGQAHILLYSYVKYIDPNDPTETPRITETCIRIVYEGELDGVAQLNTAPEGPQNRMT